MLKRKIYLLRHGEIDQSYRGRFVGQTDLPLTDTGEFQARFWEHELCGEQFGAIYCSDLVRSQNTAKIIAALRGISIEVTPELREINLGEWDGLPVSDIKSHFPDEWRMRGENLASYRPPGGESFSDLASRVVPVFGSIVKNAEGNLLIVAHAGVNRVILCHALGMPLANLFNICQDYGCMNILELSGDSFRLKTMNILPSVRTCKSTIAVCP
ncbi:MAG: alpha-ribazole phosphatase [Syntrophaceae bacterium]|nr:alpha-ribazole phosphatase [Syntrophaceae bacterium]